MSWLLTRYTLLIPGRACDGLYASYNINSTSFWKHYSDFGLFWRDNVMQLVLLSGNILLFSGNTRNYCAENHSRSSVSKILRDHLVWNQQLCHIQNLFNHLSFPFGCSVWPLGCYLNRVYKTIMQSLPHDWLNKYLYHFKSGILRIILAQWHSLRNKGFSIKVLKDHSVRSNICNFSSWQRQLW